MSKSMLSSTRSCRPRGRLVGPHGATHDIGRLRCHDAAASGDEGRWAVPHVFAYPRDPDDEPYVDLAIATHASFLVSRDNDLLDLMKDEGVRKSYPGITVLGPVAFLQHFRAEIGKESGPG